MAASWTLETTTGPWTTVNTNQVGALVSAVLSIVISIISFGLRC